MQNVNEQVRLDSRNGTGQVRLGSAGCHWITPRWDPTDVKPSVRSNPEDVSNVGEGIHNDRVRRWRFWSGSGVCGLDGAVGPCWVSASPVKASQFIEGLDSHMVEGLGCNK